MTPPLARESLLPRIDGMRKNLAKLRQLSLLTEKEFSSDDPYALAQHHLRLALEGVFHIGAHILSRLPGGRATEYREIASKLGDLDVVPKEFAYDTLRPMAGMRNILVHQYADIAPDHLQQIIRHHRSDIEQFLQYIAQLLKAPERLGLTLQ
jgi:uncharacterized protein YutE (UPF0331/DUF86 family)